MMDLNNDEFPRGGLRFYFQAAFTADFSTMVLEVLAPRHHLMMDLKLAKPQGKPLGFNQATINRELRHIWRQKYGINMAWNETNDDDWLQTIDHNEPKRPDGVASTSWGNNLTLFTWMGWNKIAATMM